MMWSVAENFVFVTQVLFWENNPGAWKCSLLLDQVQRKRERKKFESLCVLGGEKKIKGREDKATRLQVACKLSR